MPVPPPAVVPPRLHVLLARDGRSGVVIRRGPTRHTAVIGWDRRNDSFALGQWLYGRIYERRSDLSPDGRWLIYFAMNGRWDGPAKGAWTAISRAPYLQAEALFAKGDCWHGGGLFESGARYWLNAGYGHTTLHDHTRLQRSELPPSAEDYGGECPGVYYLRLQRDGWVLRGGEPQRTGQRTAIFDKPAGRRWLLRKQAHASAVRPAGRGVYFDTHELVHASSGTTLAQPDWEWADMDGERLVWAAGGCLHTGRLDATGVQDAKVLHDFRGMAFERIAAPY